MNNKYILNQTQKLERGFIDRRQFITTTLAAGLALPMALTVVDKIRAATPQKGGTLKMGYGYGSSDNTLDPSKGVDDFTAVSVLSYANNLLEVDAKGSLVNELAETYESTDAKTWVFKLRKGVEFHNGKTLAAEDVLATFNYHRDPATKSNVAGLLDQVENIRIDGEDVIFELKAPNSSFPFITSDYHLAILPSKDGKILPLSGIGTGGYIIESFEPGKHLIGKRNPNYFKQDRAHFDSIEVLAQLDAAVRQSSIINGETHLINKVDPNIVELMSHAPGLEILDVVGNKHYDFPMRLDTKPFDNLDFRIAMKSLINRQEMLDKVLRGYGVLGNDHPISSASKFHASDLLQRQYNPEKAKFHYKKSGHHGPIQLSASDAAFTGAVDAAKLISKSAAEVGIDIQIIQEPADGYWSKVWNKKPWSAAYWTGRPTEDWMFSAGYIASSGWNDTAWKNTEAAKQFNKLIIEARAELDDEKRGILYREAQTLIHDDGGAIIPMFANHIHVVSTKLGHGDVAGDQTNDGDKAQERWWFKDEQA